MTKIIAGHISGRLPQLRKRPRGNPAWVKGHNQAGPGRPKGSPDRYTRELKKALLDAVEFVGEEFAAAEAAEAAKQGRAVDPNAPRGVIAGQDLSAVGRPEKIRRGGSLNPVFRLVHLHHFLSHQSRGARTLPYRVP
jgi:hypothetical protein